MNFTLVLQNSLNNVIVSKYNSLKSKELKIDFNCSIFFFIDLYVCVYVAKVSSKSAESCGYKKPGQTDR